MVESKYMHKLKFGNKKLSSYLETLNRCFNDKNWDTYHGIVYFGVMCKILINARKLL